MLEPDLITFITAGLTGAVGGVHLGNVPQNQPVPSVCVIRLPGQTPRTLDNTRLFSRTDVQIVVVGDDRFAPVLALSGEVLELLDGYKGTMGATRIESCRCVSEPADQSYIDGTKTIRQLALDFKFVHRAA